MYRRWSVHSNLGERVFDEKVAGEINQNKGAVLFPEPLPIDTVSIFADAPPIIAVNGGVRGTKKNP